MEALSCYGCGASWHSAAAIVWAEESCPGCGGPLKAAEYLSLDANAADVELNGWDDATYLPPRFQPAPNSEGAT